MSKKALNVNEIVERLGAISVTNGSDKVAIAKKTVSPGIGSLPCVAITDVHVGFDWDMGTVFLQTESPIQAMDEEFVASQQLMHSLQEQLYWVGHTLRENVSAEEKVARISQMLEARRAAYRKKRVEHV